MCGIAGLLELKPNVEHPESPGKILRRMLDTQRHRGPDDRGEEKITSSSGQHLYLGHQRLAIIDLSLNAHQPMPNDPRNIWISTNSEIYNYRELREELQSDFTFKSQSDTEVLLRAYEKWGVDCLNKLRGMFAFAIWDGPNNRLFLARDRLGIKPLYYFHDENVLVFASEMRALLASELIRPQVDPSGFYHYLSFGHVSSPLLKDMQELPPAHSLIADGNKIKKNKYWNPIGYRIIPNKKNEVIEMIGSRLSEAIHLHQVSDVPLGAFLSGGIDSGAIVALLSANGKTRPKSLTVSFDEKTFDESSYARLMAQRFSTDHRDIPLKCDDLLHLLPSAISAMDQPTIDGINTYVIAKAARQSGITVAMSGLGGDELFAGYDSFTLAPRLRHWQGLASTLPGFIRELAPMFAGGLPADQKAKLSHYLQGKLNGAHPYYLVRALFCEDRLARLFHDKEIFEQERSRHIEETRRVVNALDSIGDVEQISYLELTHYTANMLLRDTDMMSMAHGLEVRVPFLDHKLVELMFSVPGNMKLKAGSSKPLLVEALSGKLPKEVVSRKKMGFTFPFETWMRDSLRGEIEGVLLSPCAPLDNLLSQTETESVWKDFLEQRTSWSRPWALYILKKWIDKNL